MLGAVVWDGVWVRFSNVAYQESTSIKTKIEDKERRAVREPPPLRDPYGALPAIYIYACVVNNGVVPQNQPLF